MNWLIIIMIICLVMMLSGKKPDHTYKAEFGNSSKYLSEFNHGFAIGNKALSKKISVENFACFGPTGAGKSSGIIIPSAESLSRGNSSVVFFDLSGEIFENVSGFQFQEGYNILKLDLGTGKYESFNPLARLKSIADIQRMAHLIVINSMGESKTDEFWNRSSEMIITLFARYLIYYAEPRYRNLYNLLRLVEKFIVTPEKVDLLFVKTDSDLLDSYKSALGIGEKTLQSVIASVRASLNLWYDESVIRATCTDSIDFSLLRKEKTCLYVTLPLKDIHYFKPLSALFFQTLFNELMSSIPEKGSRSVFTILDEAATMKFSNLSTTISNIRKYNSGILLCMQDEMALVSQYGQAEAHQIKTNCGTQAYLKGQPLHTAKEISQLLGRKTFTDEKGIERNRELRTPDEIRMSDDAIVLINNSAPLLCKIVPYYKRLFTRLGKIPPFQLTEKTITNPPHIEFDSK